MSLLSELLQRLRRPGVPGPPRPAAVPADPAAAMEEELEPVLRRVEPVAARGDALIEEATGAAAQIRSRAARRAKALRQAARAEAPRAQSVAASSRLAAVEEEKRAILDGAVGEATRIDQLVAQRLDDVAGQLVERALRSAERRP